MSNKRMMAKDRKLRSDSQLKNMSNKLFFQGKLSHCKQRQLTQYYKCNDTPQPDKVVIKKHKNIVCDYDTDQNDSSVDLTDCITESDSTVKENTISHINQPQENGLHTIQTCSSAAFSPLSIHSPPKHLNSRPNKVVSNKKHPMQLHTDNQTKLDQFYPPVRRSVRKSKTTVLREKLKHFEDAVLNKQEFGLEVMHFEGKGRGVIATRQFNRGEFVVEYAGELIKSDKAKRREQLYSKDENTGCYMYYFVHKNNQYCVDATEESGRLGRLVNHSRNGNLGTKVIQIGSQPRLVLVAKEDIQPGDEVTYDYGDRSKESIRCHPWLAN